MCDFFFCFLKNFAILYNVVREPSQSPSSGRLPAPFIYCPIYIKIFDKSKFYDYKFYENKIWNLEKKCLSLYKEIEIMKTRTNTTIEKEITLIDTYNVDYDDYVEDFKEHCEINGYELCGEGHNMEGLYMGGRISFLAWVGECISSDCIEFWNDLRRVKNGSYIDYYVVTGSLGLWYGRRGGICETFNNLYDALSKCAEYAYDIIAKCDGKKIEFENLHHDGTNEFTIYRISWDDSEKIEWWDNEKDGDVFDFIEKHALPITYEMLGR